MWHASVAVMVKVRRRGQRNTTRTLYLAELHPDEVELCESVARRLLDGAGQGPDAVGVDLSKLPADERTELPEKAVHRRRRLTEGEMATLSNDFLEAAGSPACPAMVME